MGDTVHDGRRLDHRCEELGGTRNEVHETSKRLSTLMGRKPILYRQPTIHRHGLYAAGYVIERF